MFSIKNRKIIIVVIIAIIMALSVLYGIYPQTHSKTIYTSYYEYTVIISNVTNDFEILCPLPINGAGESYENLTQEIIVRNGPATLHTISTENGMALQISGKNQTLLEWKATINSGESGEGFWNLSMTEFASKWGYDGSAWVYSSLDGVFFKLFFNYTLSYEEDSVTYGHSFMYEGDGNLKMDWQQVPIKCSRVYT